MPSCTGRLGPSTSPIVLSSKAFVRLRPAHHPINTVDPGLVHVGDDFDGDRTLAAHADMLIVPAGTPADVATRIRRLCELAESAGRRWVRFGISIRPVVGLDHDGVEALCRSVIRVAPAETFGEDRPSSPAARRLVLAAMTCASGSAAPFVGTIDEMQRRLSGYEAAGVEVFQLRGFDPLADVVTLGAVVDLLRARVPSDEPRTASVIWSRMSRARLASTCPAVVSCTRRPVRSSSRAPVSLSSTASCCDTRSTRSGARPKRRRGPSRASGVGRAVGAAKESASCPSCTAEPNSRSRNVRWT